MSGELVRDGAASDTEASIGTGAVPVGVRRNELGVVPPEPEPGESECDCECSPDCDCVGPDPTAT